MTGMTAHDGIGPHASEPIEWEDTMPEMNQASTPGSMGWAIVDDETGAENMDIDWTFQLGEHIKLRTPNHELDPRRSPHAASFPRTWPKVPSAEPQRRHQPEPRLEGHRPGDDWRNG